MADIIKAIGREIEDYNEPIDLSEGVSFSQPKLVKKISQCEAQVFPKGKKDSQGKYKYWFDIITPRVNAEVKNIDFDTKDAIVYSDHFGDKLAVLLSNFELSNFLRDANKGEEFNNNIETFSSWGNVVWKKTKEGYEEVDLKNFYVLNQTAKTLDDSDVIERHILTQADLRAKKGAWENVDAVIKDCGDRFFSSTRKSRDIDKSSPSYEIYERNGEVSEADLFKVKGMQGGDPDKFILAKIISPVAGIEKDGEGKKYCLFAQEISEKPYKEAHRGRYKGRWFREGMYEILFDCHVRANEIGNQLARGLEWASKTFFRTSDTLIIQNALTDLRNGAIIRAKELSQVETRMQGFDQLIADWNRNIRHADELANSYEVVTGESLPSGTPFRLGAMLNQNANKLFDFLREKLAIALEDLFNEWIIPKVMRKTRAKKVIELTGSGEALKEYREMLVNAWYVGNLLSFPPHSSEQAVALKAIKSQELARDKGAMAKIEEGFWEGFKPRARVIISGENVNLARDLTTLATFIQLEADPLRRSHLVELALSKSGVNISDMPRSAPEQLTGRPAQVPQGQAPQEQPVLTT